MASRANSEADTVSTCGLALRLEFTPFTYLPVRIFRLNQKRMSFVLLVSVLETKRLDRFQMRFVKHVLVQKVLAKFADRKITYMYSISE